MFVSLAVTWGVKLVKVRFSSNQEKSLAIDFKKGSVGYKKDVRSQKAGSSPALESRNL
jgi:hypothetical protein